MIEIEDSLFVEILDIITALKRLTDDISSGERQVLMARLERHGAQPLSSWSLRRLVDNLGEDFP